MVTLAMFISTILLAGIIATATEKITEALKDIAININILASTIREKHDL